MKLYQLVEQFVADAFQNQPVILVHLQRTEHWARKLLPYQDEVIYCAALAHDIEKPEITAGPDKE